MTTTTSTHIQLASRPTGWPTPENFSTARISYPDLSPGQVRVANEFVSVDPYMRGRMNDVRSYTPPYALGETITGGAIGRVVESTTPEIPVGSVVLHQQGWSDIAQGDAAGFRMVPEIPGAPLSLYLGILGMTGLTGYVGLTAVAKIQPGDTVFVSGAAGAVGTATGQLARLLGASRVIGSAGSAEKVQLLTKKYGYDAAFNYKDAPVREQLPQVLAHLTSESHTRPATKTATQTGLTHTTAATMPTGIDVFFDNVGGDHLEAALDVMNDKGRIALCGAIAGYNNTTRVPGPDNMPNIITRGLTLQGFTLGSYLHLAPEFNQKIAAWFRDGKIAYDETVVDGIENTVTAFLDMMRGANTGKMVVRVHH